MTVRPLPNTLYIGNRTNTQDPVTQVIGFFVAFNFVAFLKYKGQHTPDIRMDGFEWEIKTPQGNSKRTIENNFRNAVMQSKYIIFDLRRIKLHDNQCVPKLEKEFRVRRYLKKLLIIKKDGTLLEIT